jgi:hypothetical protein
MNSGKKANPIQAQLDLQEMLKKKQKPNEFITVKKGKKRGKKKADPEKVYRAYMKQNNGGFDYDQMDRYDFADQEYKPEEENVTENNQGQTLVQKSLDFNSNPQDDIALGF